MMDDGIFNEKSIVSLVFDYVTYNGNIDTFVYSTIRFKQSDTGILDMSADATVLPLEMYSGGGYYAIWRILVCLMFAVYVFLVLYFLYLMIEELLETRSKKTLMRHPDAAWYKFLIDHFSDFFNLLDLVAACISITNIVYIVAFILTRFRYQYYIS